MKQLLTEIVNEGEPTLLLNEMIEVEETKDYHTVYWSYPPLNIQVWGGTREQARAAFHFMFLSLFQNYAQADDSELTETARELKQQILLLAQVKP